MGLMQWRPCSSNFLGSRQTVDMGDHVFVRVAPVPFCENTLAQFQHSGKGRLALARIFSE